MSVKRLKQHVLMIATRNLINKALSLRQQNMRGLLKTTNEIKKDSLKSEQDFGSQCHTASSEPFYYDSAYTITKHDVIPVDEEGKCIIAEHIDDSSGKKWKCTKECKTLLQSDINAIVSFRQAFEEPNKQNLRYMLFNCDKDCPNGHYYTHNLLLLGHPLVCHNEGGCKSTLRILRSASTHYPVLRNFLKKVYKALTYNHMINNIDNALCSNNIQSIMKICKIADYVAMLALEVDDDDDDSIDPSGSVYPDITEDKLYLEYAYLIKDFENEIYNYPDRVCCSCKRLLRIKNR